MYRLNVWCFCVDRNVRGTSCSCKFHARNIDEPLDDIVEMHYVDMFKGAACPEFCRYRLLNFGKIRLADLQILQCKEYYVIAIVMQHYAMSNFCDSKGNIEQSHYDISSVISGASTLPKDEVDRMVSEADKFGEEDKKRREAVDLKNQGESLIYQTEKQLKEFEGKVCHISTVMVMT